MSTTKENVLVAPCGLSCGHCEFYLTKDDSALMEYMVTRVGIPGDKVTCQGCRPLEGKCASVDCTMETLNDLSAAGSTCATYACSVEHGVDFCYECPEFPCVKLQPCIDGGNILPHNSKVFNLCCLQRQGLDEWLKNYNEIMGLYRFGKIVIGKGPQMTEAVIRTFQEIQEQLQQIRDQLRQHAESGRSQE